MELTEWVFGNVEILEPITALTDILITVVCLWGFCKLTKLSKTNNNYLKRYPYFILFMGLGTFFAALMTHSFAYIFNPELISKSEIAKMDWSDKFMINLHNFPNWLFNIVSVTFFEISVIKRAKFYLTDLNTKLYYWIIGVESVTILVLLMWILKYDIAISHIGIALFLISLPLQFKIYKKFKAQDAKYLIIGTLVMLIIAPVMITKFEFCKWFNFNDISHIVIATTMFIFTIAGIYMYDKPTVEIPQKS